MATDLVALDDALSKLETLDPSGILARKIDSPQLHHLEFQALAQRRPGKARKGVVCRVDGKVDVGFAGLPHAAGDLLGCRVDDVDDLAALGCDDRHVLVCSTGVIGQQLPIETFRRELVGLRDELRPN